MEILTFKHEQYSLTWDEKLKIVRCVLHEGFNLDAAFSLKKDATRLVEAVRGRGVSKIRVLHDVSRLTKEYRPDAREKAVMLDVLEVVDQVALFGLQSHVLKVMIEFFNIASFLYQGKKSAFFETEELATEWLLED